MISIRQASLNRVKCASMDILKTIMFMNKNKTNFVSEGSSNFILKLRVPLPFFIFILDLIFDEHS